MPSLVGSEAGSVEMDNLSELSAVVKEVYLKALESFRRKVIQEALDREEERKLWRERMQKKGPSSVE